MIAIKIVAIIQARMGSTRLPGKVLKTVRGKPLLAYQLERVQRSVELNEIVVATTTRSSDEPIIDFCKTFGVSCFLGSEEDVLSRYVEAAREYKADVIVRLTADCPIIDPDVIDETIRYFVHQPNLDYVSNTMERPYPSGQDVEVFSVKVLTKTDLEATETPYREHVTPYMYKGDGEFSVGHLACREDWSHYRLTVDTPEDFELIRVVIENLYEKDHHFSLEDIISLLNRDQKTANINSHIEQKQWNR